jgi:uncharacterized protein (TIGR02118 family)
MFTVVFLVKKKASMSLQEFSDYWINEHTPLTKKAPGVVQYRCYPMTGYPDRQPPFDAVAILSFADKAAHDLAMASPEFKTALADAANFQTTEETLGFFADEFIIV